MGTSLEGCHERMSKRNNFHGRGLVEQRGVTGEKVRKAQLSVPDRPSSIGGQDGRRR